MIASDGSDTFPAVSIAYTTYVSGAKPAVLRAAGVSAVAGVETPLAVSAAASMSALVAPVSDGTRYSVPSSLLVAEISSPTITGPAVTSLRTGEVSSAASADNGVIPNNMTKTNIRANAFLPSVFLLIRFFILLSLPERFACLHINIWAAKIRPPICSLVDSPIKYYKYYQGSPVSQCLSNALTSNTISMSSVKAILLVYSSAS